MPEPSALSLNMLAKTGPIAVHGARRNKGACGADDRFLSSASCLCVHPAPERSSLYKPRSLLSLLFFLASAVCLILPQRAAPKCIGADPPNRSCSCFCTRAAPPAFEHQLQY